MQPRTRAKLFQIKTDCFSAFESQNVPFTLVLKTVAKAASII